MSPRRRQLMQAVMEGRPELPNIMWHFDRLTRCDAALEWCIKNKITGVKFVEFYQENGCSILRTAANILERINAETVKGKILAGKDYVTS